MIISPQNLTFLMIARRLTWRRLVRSRASSAQNRSQTLRWPGKMLISGFGWRTDRELFYFK
ncbi:MAG TPA: hypothetical protein DD640_08735 [Clostridiales bacterium]|nr:hypothetical protein [Clostridiales bacterium]